MKYWKLVLLSLSFACLAATPEARAGEVKPQRWAVIFAPNTPDCPPVPCTLLEQKN